MSRRYVVSRRCVTSWLHWMLPKQVARMVFQPGCLGILHQVSPPHSATVQSVIEVMCHSIWLEEIPDCSNTKILMAVSQPTITPSLVSKLLEWHVYSLVMEHLLCHHPLAACQWDFLEGRSTITALLHCTNEWLKALGDGKDVQFSSTAEKHSIPSLMHRLCPN